MPDSTDLVCPTLPIASIEVRRAERQRREIKTDDLQESIKLHGLISPIVVRAEPPYYILVAGERRLEACRNLGWTSIPIRFFEDLSPTEAQIIELEENVKRLDLTWKESSLAMLKVHNLHLEQDPEWTMAETAYSLSVSPVWAGRNIRIAKHLEQNDQRIADCGTLGEAYNILIRRDQRAEGELLAALLKKPTEPTETIENKEPSSVVTFPTPTPQPDISESILHESFLDWAPTYQGEKFNLIHCDFPYGINPFSGPQGRGANPDSYQDSTDLYFQLLDCLLDNLPKISSLSSHLFFWYSDKLRNETLERFRLKAPQFQFYPFPLIWLKSDNAGISADSRRHPRHIYETCLFAYCGDRNILKIVGDAYSAPTDHKHHPSCKPESMLKHFFSLTVDENTSLLDPTCGSGSALRAAESLGAKFTLGLESDWDYCETARLQLKNFRLLRKASS